MAEARIPVHCSEDGSNLQALIDLCASDAPGSIRGKIAKENVTPEDKTTGIIFHYVVAEVERGEPILVQKISC
ncbi:hypothetical protein F4814DRAFT_444030 [Daldinia grandis]|nr:hypothetical protein F4814DRAFT_444030 [Daldinia grandis]